MPLTSPLPDPQAEPIRRSAVIIGALVAVDGSIVLVLTSIGYTLAAGIAGAIGAGLAVIQGGEGKRAITTPPPAQVDAAALYQQDAISPEALQQRSGITATRIDTTVTPIPDPQQLVSQVAGPSAVRIAAETPLSTAQSILAEQTPDEPALPASTAQRIIAEAEAQRATQQATDRAIRHSAQTSPNPADTPSG